MLLFINKLHSDLIKCKEVVDWLPRMLIQKRIKEVFHFQQEQKKLYSKQLKNKHTKKYKKYVMPMHRKQTDDFTADCLTWWHWQTSGASAKLWSAAYYPPYTTSQA